jgi:hypothetical protein
LLRRRSPQATGSSATPATPTEDRQTCLSLQYVPRSRTSAAEDPTTTKRREDTSLLPLQRTSEVNFEEAQSARNSVQAEASQEVDTPLLCVRRLTPTECETLQGFPPGWTIPSCPKD